jgi:Na+/H+-dicarboxylate symporter
LTESGADAPREAARGLKPYAALAALVAGLALGTFFSGYRGDAASAALGVTSLVGGLWLNALKMTVVPLIVTLLVTGVAKGAEAALGGRIAARTVAWIVAVCTASAIFGTLMMQLLMELFPLSRTASDALRAAVTAIEPAAASATVPKISDFFTGVIPPNVVAAASNGDVLALVVFSLLFALAIVQLPDAQKRALVGLFEAIGNALLIIIGWVLWVGPIGVFALAYTVGVAAGGDAFAGMLHYVVLISGVGLLLMIAAYPLAIIAGRLAPGRFARAMLAPQAVAISTRSSLASLPAMLAAARALGIRDKVADVSLPLAVALFRGTGPAMNAGVAIYIAHWLGLHPSLGQIVAAVAVAAVISYGSVSLPGEITFISSIAPIAMALGVPIAPLALFVAVEMIPDIFRTVGNVSLDVAVTAAVDRSARDGPADLNGS